MSGGGSTFEDLIVLANNGGSSYAISNDSQPALNVNASGHVGINTLTPGAQLEVVNDNGDCLRMRRGAPTGGTYADFKVSDTGDFSISSNAVGSKILLNSSLDITTHDGSTAGLHLGGELVTATAAQLNYNDVSPGVAEANKSLVLDANRNISNINALSASTITGTIQTAAQPNITSLGTLSSLTVTGAISAGTIDGFIQTADQPNITSLGTLSTLTVNGAVNAGTVAGTLTTPAQPNITSVGALGSLTVSGATVSSEMAYLAGAIPGTASASHVLVADATGSIAGINSLTATNLSGVIQTATQPNITSVGTLASLNVTGAVTAASLTGTIQTASQPKITSVGNLTSISVAGATVSTEAAYLAGSVPGTASANHVLVLDGNKSITGINTVSASRLVGALQTASQPNITSIGNLNSVNIGGAVIGPEAAYLSGTVAGTAAGTKALVLNSSKSITGINSIGASTLTGTLLSAAQPNVTSVGVLTGLTVSGVSTFTSTTDSTSPTTGAIKVAGGMGIAKSLHVGGGIYGTVKTAAQTGITSLGTLSGLNISGNLTVGGSITVNGVPVLGGGGGGSNAPEYTLDITPGTAARGKALVLNSAGAISGINSLSASTLTGVLQTAAQPNITQVGTLANLTVTNRITAANLTGTLQTSAQPNITSVGALTDLNVAGAVNITSGANAVDETDGGALTISGGLAVAQDTHIGGSIVIKGSLVVNGVDIGGGGNTFFSNVEPGSATAGNALVLDENKEIANISLVDTKDIVTNGTIEAFGGTSWAAASTTDETIPWTSVAWSPDFNTFIAVSSNTIATNNAQSSTDGVSWVGQSISKSAWTSICYSSDKLRFVAVANSGTQRVTVSKDGGATWLTPTWSGNGSPWTSVCWAGGSIGKFVAVASSTTSNIIYSSYGDYGWSIKTVAGTSGWQSVCWSDKLDMLVAVASAGTSRVMTSTSGSVWVVSPSANDANTWKSVCWSPELEIFVAVADSGTNRLMTSTDGTTWTGSAAADETASWTSVCWAAEISLFVAVASAGTHTVMTSPDGVTWTGRNSSNPVNEWNSVCWSPEASRFVAVATSGTDRSMVSTHLANTSISLLDVPAVSGQTEAKKMGISAGAMMGFEAPAHAWFVNDKKIMNVTSTGLGIGTIPTSALDISDPAGTCLRLRGPNDLTCDLTVDSSGFLEFSSGVIFSYMSNATTPTSGGVRVLGGVSVAQDIVVGGLATFASALSITSTDESTGFGTGALIVGGGLSCSGTLNAGSINCSTISVSGATQSTSTSTGSMVLSGGLGVAGNTNIGGTVSIESTAESTSTTTGALIVGGGLGIGGNLSIGGSFNVADETESTSTATGALVLAGGLGVGKRMNVGGAVKINDATASTSTTTGALVVAGGVGAGGDMNVGGAVSAVGDLTVSGGLGVGGSLNAGGSMTVSGDVDIAGNLLSESLSITVPDSLNTANMTTWSRLQPSNTVYTGLLHSSGAIVYFDVGYSYYTKDNFATSTQIVTTSNLFTPLYFTSTTVHNGKTPKMVENKANGNLLISLSYITSASARYIGLFESVYDSENGTFGAFVEIHLKLCANYDPPSYVATPPIVVSANKWLVAYREGSYIKFLIVEDNVVSDKRLGLSTSFGLNHTDTPDPPTVGVHCSGFGNGGMTLGSVGDLLAYSQENLATPGYPGTGNVMFTYIQTRFSNCYSMVYNKLLNMAIAALTGGIYYTFDGMNWTKATNPLGTATADQLIGVVSVPGQKLFIGMTSNKVLYSYNGIDWTLAGDLGRTYTTSDPVHGLSVNEVGRILAGSYNSKAYWSNDAIAINTPCSIAVSNGYLETLSGSGHKWYTESVSAEDPGVERMSLTSAALTTNVVHAITDITDSTDTSTGALVVAGGVGIAGALNVGGDGNFGGTVTQASDSRLKTDVTSLEIDEAKKLYDNSVVTYKWKNTAMDQSQQVGVIAQDLALAGLNDLVRLTNNASMEEGEDTKLEPAEKQWAVNYAGISAYNMKMIAYLIQENKTLKARLAALENP